MAEVLETHTLLFLTSCSSPLFLVTDIPALLPFPRVPASLPPFSGFALGIGACAPVLSAWLFHLDWSSGQSQTRGSVFCRHLWWVLIRKGLLGSLLIYYRLTSKCRIKDFVPSNQLQNLTDPGTQFGAKYSSHMLLSLLTRSPALPSRQVWH